MNEQLHPQVAAMLNFVDPAAFRAWTLCAAFLFLKMFANTAVQFHAKRRDRLASLPEDRAFFGKREPRPESESDLYQRAAGCWENDLENIPMFLILGLAYVGLGGTAATSTVIFSAFSLSRVAHTVFYLKATQPHRAIAYTAGLVATLALAVGIVINQF